jgi:phosphoribosylformylglycinamidine cyclo-ligase
MGVGMTAVVSRSSTDEALAVLASRGVTAWVLGEIVPGTGEAQLTGTHPAAG